MLNPNCPICTERFAANQEICATPCGHVFHNECLTKWLRRSSTCPQCRYTCTCRSTIRIYLNNGSLDDSRVDACALQEQLDETVLKWKTATKEIEDCKKALEKTNETNKKAMETIAGMQEKIESSDFVIQTYIDQVKTLKQEAKIVSQLRKEVEEFKTKLRAVDGVASILAASTVEADKMAKGENDPKVLRLWVTSLKRELRQSEHKKSDMRNLLKIAQADCRNEIALRKEKEEQLSRLESENYAATEKLKQLEAKLSTVPSCIPKALENIAHTERRTTLSPAIKENIKQIQESVSPYLNIKSSSVGLAPILKRSAKAFDTCNSFGKIKISPIKRLNDGTTMAQSTNLSEQYSIFKKPRLGGAVNPIIPKNDFVYDGLGGSERIDPFTRDQTTQPVNKFLIATNNATKKLDGRLKAGGLRNFKINK